ncbi:hypothetical protein WJX73_002857 [Symbiochloris irregularis]|uniref:Uncharacterized protein n=1 Tax=Symbiochloris irregularis TaxID=706552 RepID=A0AAW1NRH3_9CHLO
MTKTELRKPGEGFKPYAVKYHPSRLHKQVQDAAADCDELVREGEMIKALQGKSVVPLIGWIMLGSVRVQGLVMPWLEGRTLEEAVL